MKNVSLNTLLRLAVFSIGIALLLYFKGAAEAWALFIKILDFVLILSVIVFIHEFGHYIVAKWCGVKIDAFSIGFGKEIFGFNDRSGTRWKFSMLPLGGYVKMYGDANEASTPSEDLENLTEEEKSKTFHHKSLPRKAAIVAAGPLANFILTIVIFTCFIATNGLPSTEPVVGDFVAGAPAEKGGLKIGDRILSVNGEEVEVFSDIQRLIATNLGTPVMLHILRDGKESDLKITPEIRTDKDKFGNDFKRPLIGISTKAIKYEDVGPVRSVWEATKNTYNVCTMTLKAIGQMITGQRSVSEIKGPLGIAQLSGQAVAMGFSTIMWFIAMLSANLGLVNILPIPMLDGGHLAFYAIEGVRRKPLGKRAQEFGFKIGMAMLGMLMVYAVFNDIRNMKF